MSKIRIPTHSSPLDPRNQSGGKTAVRNREMFYAGDVIIEQGDEAHRAYYIESGRVEVIIRENRKELKVAELGPGDIFGEMALLSKNKRSATVRSLEATSVVIITNDDLIERLKNVKDEAVRALIFMFIKRLGETTKGQMRQYTNLADLKDGIIGMVEHVGGELEATKRQEFQKEIQPLMKQLQDTIDKYKKA